MAKRLTPEEKAEKAAAAAAWPKFGFPKDYVPADSRVHTQPVFSGDTKTGWVIADTPTEAANAYRKKFAKEMAELKAQGS